MKKIYCSFSKILPPTRAMEKRGTWFFFLSNFHNQLHDLILFFFSHNSAVLLSMLLSWEMIHRSGSHNSGDLTLTGSPLDNDLDVDMDMLDAGISLTTAPIPELEIVDIVGDEVGLPYSRFYLCHNSLPTRRKAASHVSSCQHPPPIPRELVSTHSPHPTWAPVNTLLSIKH